MASTSLFAPQVRHVQPAFIYDLENGKGEAKIYFSPSAYNNINDINYIAFSFIDPDISVNQLSNSMFNLDIITTGYAWKPKNQIFVSDRDNINEYYFKINLNSNIYKTLSKNKYYQLQLFFLTELNVLKPFVSQEELNSSNCSLGSQITYIRPIANHIVFLELPKNEGQYEAPFLRTVQGKILYDDNSTVESVSMIKMSLLDSENKIIYKNNYQQNSLGTSFIFNFKDCYLEQNKIYTLTIDYITLNGYNGTYNCLLNTALTSGLVSNWKIEITSRGIDAGRTLTILTDLPATHSNTANRQGYFYIQRASYLSNYQKWEDVYALEVIDQFNTIKQFTWEDFCYESSIFYKYRVLFEDINGKISYSSSYPEEGIIDTYEYVYLLGKDMQLALKYNANVSNYTYTVQEAINNTIGGKYPIVVRNGQTKYKTFSLSGTLSFEDDIFNLLFEDNEDSYLHQMSTFFQPESNILFSKDSIISGAARDILLNYRVLLKSVLSTDKQPSSEPVMIKGKNLFSIKSSLQKMFRDAVINFLSDGKPKIFKSPTEGLILVYLSGLQFTPNQQLGKEVWDFSATVTEINEINNETLKQYDIIPDAKDILNWTLVLKSYGLVEEVPAIRELTYDETNDQYYVTLKARILNDLED